MRGVIRKILVVLASLAIALSLFLLYNRISGTAEIEVDRNEQAVTVIGDANGFEATAGSIGDDLKIGVVEDTVFLKYNQQAGTVARKIGFRKLLNEVKDIWEVEKPFMSIFQRNFECHVTADKGSVQLETALGNPTPKDATFTGNVEIHVIPKGTEKFTESWIYLDNIVFLSEKSQFSTIGPVRFESETAHMDGRGLEFVYDEQSERLEYLRLVHLDQLILKSTADALVSDGPQPAEVTRQNDAAERTSAAEPVDESARNTQVAARVGAGTESTSSDTAAVTEEAVRPRDGQFYSCVLSKNVLIRAPEQVVFADDRVNINDIFWSHSSSNQAQEAEADVSDANAAPVVSGSTRSQPLPTEAAKTKDVPAQAVEPKAESTQPELVDIVVTCDNGVLLVPENSSRTIEDFPAARIPGRSGENKLTQALSDNAGKTAFATGTVDYSVTTRNTTATGPSELTFFAKDTPGSQGDSPAVPVHVTADRDVSYIHAANKVIFDVNCVCRMPQRDLSVPQEATLRSPRITVDLLRDSPDASPASADITATGPVSVRFYIEDPNAEGPDAGPQPVTVTARKHAKYLSETQQVVFEQDCVCAMPQRGLAADERYMLRAPVLTVNMAAEEDTTTSGLSDITASGPVELSFYVADFGGAKSNVEALPATVTAKKEARFSAETNQIIFDGETLCLMERDDPNSQYEYRLDSPKLTIDLPPDSNEPGTGSASGIERLVAHGGLVSLSMREWPAGLDKTEENILGGVELQCRQFDYDPYEEVFIAAGPGRIQVNNSKAAPADPNVTRGSLRRPCYVQVENFDTLKYYLQQNHIVADAESVGSLAIHYLPLKDGRVDQHLLISASHMEASMQETPEGDLELASLIATEGISGEDAQGKNTFEGTDLFYDHSQGMMQVSGNETMPCMYNGNLVEGIQYDVRRGRLKTRIAAPGAIPLN